MLKPWLTSVASYVAKNGFGTPGTDLFIGVMPDAPRACTVLMGVGGPVFRGDPVRRPMLRVLRRVPPDQASAGMTYIGSLHELFNNQWNRLDTANLGRFIAVNEPGLFTQDENNDIVYSLNYMFTRVS